MKASAKKKGLCREFFGKKQYLSPQNGPTTQLTGFPASTYVYWATKKNPDKKYYFFVEKFHFEFFPQKNPLVKFEILW